MIDAFGSLMLFQPELMQFFLSLATQRDLAALINDHDDAAAILTSAYLHSCSEVPPVALTSGSAKKVS